MGRTKKRHAELFLGIKITQQPGMTNYCLLEFYFRQYMCHQWSMVVSEYKVTKFFFLNGAFNTDLGIYVKS